MPALSGERSAANEPVECRGEGQMGREYCPHCREVCNMRVTVAYRRTSGPGGETGTTCVKTFHCERCGQFVRSEEAAQPEAGEGGSSESAV